MAKFNFTVVASGTVEAAHEAEANLYLEDVQHYADIKAENVDIKIDLVQEED